jgi:hypothetical protein
MAKRVTEEVVLNGWVGVFKVDRLAAAEAEAEAELATT